ncbi:protein TolR [Candidatus Poribacteria bacterium]|nr:protein TolR [Alphaproteobacteria bacterium]MBR56418.1 protein TolR [Candidatus Poribacteria bacterium]
MGVQLQPSRLRRNRRSGHRRIPISEINVTPFVDVMLVLLIIFMVTAPLLTSGVEINLPETNAGSITEPVEPLTVSINLDGRVFIQETEIELENLVPKLMAITERKTDTRIYVRGDSRIDYGRVMVIMSAVSKAGFRNVALVTEKIKAQ